MSNGYERFLGPEDKLQSAVMSYLALQYPRSLAVHCPNEGQRTKFERYKIKELGIKPGMPDVMVYEPVFRLFDGKASPDYYNGLAIELKIGKRKPTEQQRECLDLLKKAGWRCHVCNNFDDVKLIIDQYLGK